MTTAMERTPSGGSFLPPSSGGASNSSVCSSDSDDEDDFLFLEEAEDDDLYCEESESESSGLKLPTFADQMGLAKPVVAAAPEQPIIVPSVLDDLDDAPSTTKSAMKKTSSYGDLEEIGEGIPVSTKTSSWKTLPAPSGMKRVASSPALITASSSSSMKRNVSFSKIHVRDYDMTLGNNVCQYGAPVSLDWEYEEKAAMGVDDYEQYRPARRSYRQMHLNSYRRQDILRAANVSEKDVKSAKNNSDKIRRQRARTLQLLPFQKLEDMVESATRKVKRMGKNGSGMHRSKSTGCLAEEEATVASEVEQQQ